MVIKRWILKDEYLEMNTEDEYKRCVSKNLL